jgi:hypothetical protein
MKTIPLHGGKAAGRVALVDDEDYDLVMRYRWNVHEGARPNTRRKTGPYAVTKHRDGGRRRNLTMHNLITGWSRVDHINHNGLDNQRANLRPATNAQNAYNQRPHQAHTSEYKGVSWHRGKWQATINRHYIGLFVCEEDAADAYDSAARAAFGEHAYLNNAHVAGGIR